MISERLMSDTWLRISASATEANELGVILNLKFSLLNKLRCESQSMTLAI